MKLRKWIIVLQLFGLAACASPEGDGKAVSAFGTVKHTIVDVCKDAFDALQTPLADLNIKREPIPRELEDCAQNPYALPQVPVCFNIQNELAKLDAVLGPDMEAPPLPWLEKPVTKTEYVKKGISKGVAQVPKLARDQAVGFVQSKVNIIPFRGMVRKVTGAEKHADKVMNAYDAGKLRRAFLKGLSSAYNCPPSLPAPVQ